MQFTQRCLFCLRPFNNRQELRAHTKTCACAAFSLLLPLRPGVVYPPHFLEERVKSVPVCAKCHHEPKGAPDVCTRCGSRSWRETGPRNAFDVQRYWPPTLALAELQRERFDRYMEGEQ